MYYPDYEGPVKPGKDLAVSLQRFFDYVDVKDPADRKRIVALYDEEIRYVDHWLGIFFQGLEDRGLMENTVIVLVSDHGEEFWEHGRTGHGFTNFQEVLRVPLVIYHPDVPAGRRDGLVRLLDVLPTVADMVGAPARKEWQGQSLFPLIKKESETPVRFSYAELGHIPYVSVLNDRWKLVRKLSNKKLTGKASEDRLYDLEADPGETRDVAADHPEVYKRMVKLMETLMKGNEALAAGYEAGEAIIDEELRRQLDALGYGAGDH
jgi:arylsulfatase A-like enzyme